MEKQTDVIERIREFNRFYTVVIGMLDRKFLDSGYSVTENRILFELRENEPCNANFLTEKLHIDKSYMSRLLKSFERKGLVTKQTSLEDGRAFLLRLTERGREETARLIGGANRQIEALIAPLGPEERMELCKAMDVITGCLADRDGKQYVGDR